MFTSFKLSALPVRLREKIWVNPKTGCWLWTGYVTKAGYARISGARRTSRRWVYVHRATYEFFRGKISDDLELDHLCRERSCVNPAHLEPVPHTENIARGNWKDHWYRTRTHCKKGHVLDEANIVIWKNDHRRCRICNRENQRRRYQKARLLKWQPQKASSDQLA